MADRYKDMLALEEARAAMLFQAKQQVYAMDLRRSREAAYMFHQRRGLQTAIEEQIFPCVVSIKTARGVVGTGFFQHSQWLVSNAHVVPCPEALVNSMVIDAQQSTTALAVARTFHRSSMSEFAPDVVVMNTTSRAGNNNKCIPSAFSLDDGYSGRVVFYVHFNHDTNQQEIKYLIPKSGPNAYPMLYVCEDGSEPQPGCSGSPVIEARVMCGREPKWQFQSVGVIYARCHNPHGPAYACAIPVQQDFQQILQDVLYNMDSADRYLQMAQACAHIRDSASKAYQYYMQSQIHAARARCGLKEFEAGKTALDIDLPNGLEKLLYASIVSIEKSVLLTDVQETFGIEARNFKGLKSLEREELRNDFNAFIQEIKTLKSINIHNGDSLLTSPDGYFRVDVCSSGKDKEFWKLDIQDNTGKYKFKGQPLSSVFAIVRIPKATELSCLELADLFDKSQATGQEQVKLPEAIRPQQVSKAHKKKLRHGP